MERRKFRQDKMTQEKERRDELQKRAATEKELLSKIQLIKSLRRVLAEIDDESISNTKKGQKKRTVIREQVNIRKKVLQQNISIPFTTKGKQRPLPVIIGEFSEYLLCDEIDNGSSSYTSESLVGHRVLHKFEVDTCSKEKIKWFSGVIVSYNPVTSLHEIAYDEEEEHCFFNLLEDLLQGDLIVTQSN